MSADINAIHILREKTRVSLNNCKQALLEANDDILKAEKLILKRIDENVKVIQLATSESYATSLKAFNEYGSIENAIKHLNYKKYFFYNVSLNDLIDLKPGTERTDLIIKDSMVDYNCFAQIGSIETLNCLEIIECKLDEKGLIELHNLKSIKTLKIIYTNITGIGLESISKLPISHLEIIKGEIESKDLIAIKCIKTLEHLELSDIVLTFKDVEYFSDLKLNFLEFWDSYVPECVRNKLRKSLPDECIINKGEWFNDGAWRKEH